MRRHRCSVRCAGVTFTEMIVAVLLIGMAILGLISLWTVAFSFTIHSSDTGIAYDLGRHMVERLKEKGFDYLIDSKDTQTRYFQIRDTGVTELQNSTGADFRVRHRVRTGNLDSNGNFVANSSSTQDTPDDLREIQVTVRDQRTNEIIFETVTYLAKGGR